MARKVARVKELESTEEDSNGEGEREEAIGVGEWEGVDSGMRRSRRLDLMAGVSTRGRGCC